MSEQVLAVCPGVDLDPGKMSGQPTVDGYRLAAETVVEYADLGSTPEEIVARLLRYVGLARSTTASVHLSRREG